MLIIEIALGIMVSYVLTAIVLKILEWLFD